MKNVLLIGIGGVYNYGCEAIVRGTVSILKKQHSDIAIAYASYNYEYDKKRLADCDVHVINRNRKKWTFRNMIRKALSLIKIKIYLPFDSFDFVVNNNFDTVFSIGGDMYTLHHDNQYNKRLPLFCEKCVKHGIDYVLWGASVGPFDKNQDAEMFYKNHLQKAKLIVAREFKTIEYLKTIGITENVVFAPDPAFFVAPEIEKVNFEKSNRIAINLSPLSSLFYYSNYKEAINEFKITIDKLLNETDYRIIFIPHVFSKTYGDNDMLFMQDIYNLIAEKSKSRVSIITDDIGFVNVKKQLIECNYLIAARMHCAINACAANVPTLFLSYSAKAEGMANIVYGNSTNLMNLQQFTNTTLVKSTLLKNSFTNNISDIKNFDFSNVFNRIK
ncbi:MAG TPA: polysaccharide pyruvyl transferase family protein [Bacteroidales bacterium]|nr:polysaccharide pyruvyl transferase family protein [Bacteroidales bacterium]HOR82412.1 polysaccharide pyruvyl transferase family protein [Bacteroidales bacterium]HPJ91603.1 polysaccharide pyruvyl transferase family protein [Bacteroidales bacterium]